MRRLESVKLIFNLVVRLFLSILNLMQQHLGTHIAEHNENTHNEPGYFGASYLGK